MISKCFFHRAVLELSACFCYYSILFLTTEFWRSELKNLLFYLVVCENCLRGCWFRFPSHTCLTHWRICVHTCVQTIISADWSPAMSEFVELNWMFLLERVFWGYVRGLRKFLFVGRFEERRIHLFSILDILMIHHLLFSLWYLDVSILSFVEIILWSDVFDVCFCILVFLASLFRVVTFTFIIWKFFMKLRAMFSSTLTKTNNCFIELVLVLNWSGVGT